jgi:hypothetical protein
MSPYINARALRGLRELRGGKKLEVPVIDGSAIDHRLNRHASVAENEQN